MIEVINLDKSFSGRKVLHNINMNLEKGKTNMIIGASGTGKSVLLKCIVGLIPPDSGSVLFNKRDFYLSDRDTKREIRREIGMLFQGGALFDSLTVYQNVEFPLNMMTKMSASEKKERVEFCLERVGLAAAASKMPAQISGGMKKRVGIARAIVLNSQFLFCDEPNSGLDPNTSIKIDNLINEITREYNLTTVVVSHDMNSMMEIGENIFFMHNGVVVWQGSNENIMENESPELQEFIFSNNLMRKFLSEYRRRQS
jgi:phospholipid/cholesterol/gamma-HCH transport system ATP-binding protein